MNKNDNLLDKYLFEETATTPHGRWMLTFSDLLSLILTFFVLLFSMSQVNLDEWTKISRSLTQKLNPNAIVTITPPAAQNTVTRIERNSATDIDYLQSIVIQTISESETLRKIITISNNGGRLILSVDNSIMFEPETATLQDDGKAIINELSTALLPLQNHLDVYGNATKTDNLLQNTNTWWILALNRAIITAEHLRNAGYPYKITPYGRSNNSFKDLSNISDKQNRKLKTTVDIVIRAYKAKK
jgi:chemotaxis protein MotB